jgi:hypothetical protein
MLAAPRYRGIVLTAAIACGGCHSLCDRADPRTNVPVDEIGSLRRANEDIEKQRELASGNSFYLVVDPHAAEMTLTFRGAALQRYSIISFELGVPRVAFIRSNIRPKSIGTVWSGGLLDPQRPSDRVEITVSNDHSADTPPTVPLPPEVAIPVPTSYFLRYEPGLVIEIRRARTDSGAGWRRLLTRWRTHGREAMAALSPSDRHLMRLRITLKSDEADSLYRSLPPDTKLLIRDGDALQPSASSDPSVSGKPKAALASNSTSTSTG